MVGCINSYCFTEGNAILGEAERLVLGHRVGKSAGQDLKALYMSVLTH